MKFRYSVKGIVKQAFILRGLLYDTNKPINTYIGEKEIDFIKSHCELTEIVDLQKPINATPQTIPNNSKKGVVNNELSKQQATRTDKAKISRKV